MPDKSAFCIVLNFDFLSVYLKILDCHIDNGCVKPATKQALMHLNSVLDEKNYTLTFKTQRDLIENHQKTMQFFFENIFPFEC